MALLLPLDATAQLPLPMHSLTANINDVFQHSVEEVVKITVALPFTLSTHDAETSPALLAAPPPAASVQAADNMSRGFSDLHFGKFVLSVGALSAARTLLQQPMTIALTRKQACPLAAGMPTLSIVRQVYRTEGGLRRGLGRGAAALVAGQIATDVITLGVFEYARECLAGGTSDTVATFCGGYAGDAVCQAFRIPFLVIATRQMLDRGLFPQTIASTGAAVMRQGGLRSLYAGLGTTLLVGSQWTGLWWLCYTQLKGSLYARYHRLLGIQETDAPHERQMRTHTVFRGTLLDQPSIAWALDPNDNGMINSTASIVTSAVTAAVFNPYLVVRTRLQAQSGATIVGIARQVLRESGVRGFWHGTLLNINACIFDAWLASTTYEWAKLYSEKR